MHSLALSLPQGNSLWWQILRTSVRGMKLCQVLKESLPEMCCNEVIGLDQ